MIFYILYEGGRKEMEKNKKIFGTAIISFIVVAMLSVGIPAYQQMQAGAVVDNYKLHNEICPACVFFDGDGEEEFGFEGTQEEWLDKYGEEGGLVIICPLISSVMQQIISEYETNGDLDDYFSGLYGYGMGCQDHVVSSYTYDDQVSFGYIDVSEIERITTPISDPSTSVKKHDGYSYDDLSMTYEEIYHRAQAVEAWCGGGAYPSWMTADDMNAVIDCVQLILKGAGIATIAVAAYCANLFLKLDVAIAAIQAFWNFGQGIIDFAIQTFQTCVQIVSQIRDGLGLPP